MSESHVLKACITKHMKQNKNIWLGVLVIVVVAFGIFMLQSEKEHLSYSTEGVSAPVTVTREIVPFSNSAESMKTYAEECESFHPENHFEDLVSEFSETNKTVYTFKYEGESQDEGKFNVTILPNKAGYNSMDDFKKDFDLCLAGGDEYPYILNKDYLLFINACGTGYDDDSGRPHGCEEVSKVVIKTLELK